MKQAAGDKNLYGGLIRLHILHHASKGPIFGQSIMEGLGRRGYKLAAGTLYPVLHGLEKKSYLQSSFERSGRTVRRMYRVTPQGSKALRIARKRIGEVFGEVFGDDSERQ
jgi:DNA-binding PadR family transcriptional regulator